MIGAVLWENDALKTYYTRLLRMHSYERVEKPLKRVRILNSATRADPFEATRDAVLCGK